MLIILSTHPIQYQVPLWRLIASETTIPFEVWYLSDHGSTRSYDREFKQTFAWDIDLLEGYPHRFLPVSKGGSPNTFWRCRLAGSFQCELRARKAKCLWIQGWQVAGYWQAVFAARRINLQTWLRAESNDMASAAFWKRPLKRALLRGFFGCVNQFLYIGQANRKLYESFGIQPCFLHHAPYAVDNQRFKTEARILSGQRDKLRKQWGIQDDAFTILFCGKLIKKKRPMDIVHAVKKLGEQPHGKSFHILFAGSGELGDQLRSECSVQVDAENKKFIPNEGKPKATFTGFLNQAEISKAYVAADCLVLPSDFGETWGLVVNEAMASGLPCIISDQCGSSLDLGYQKQNQVYICGNIAQLSDCLRKIALENCSSVSVDLPELLETAKLASRLYGLYC